MAREFDRDQLLELGWRQGAILGRRLAELAWKHAPERVSASGRGHLVVTSHDCDMLNASITKEPLVEVLRARVSDEPAVHRSPLSSGRNPRALRLSGVSLRRDDILLDFAVHDRWEIPRQLLMQEGPADVLPRKERRLVAEWLAKRYIRAAFPTAFDLRWREKSKAWRKLLKKHSSWIQGVYLRLDTLQEMPDETPYGCHLLLAVPAAKREDRKWSEARDAIEREFTEFWTSPQLRPGIECMGVEVLTTDRITLADIERYQRFDADWISFEDDSVVTPIEMDFLTPMHGPTGR